MEKLDLAKLLKGHEKEEFYNPTYGIMTLISIEKGLLEFAYESTGRYFPGIYFNKYGVIYEGKTKLSLFPSFELYTKYPLNPQKAWQNWIKMKKLLL